MKTLTIAIFAASLLAGTAAGGVEFNSNWPVKGKRVININTVVRVNQIEVSRNRNKGKDEAEMIIDFTRYDLPAKEPPDASVKKPTRNWSLVNRINQKRRRPEDAPIPLSALTEEERRLVEEYYQKP